jgi:glutaredoxin
MINIYTMPNCPNCQEIKEFCLSNNIDYEKKDVTIDFRAKAKLIAKGLSHMPVVEINGKFIEYNQNIKNVIMELAND